MKKRINYKRMSGNKKKIWLPFAQPGDFAKTDRLSGIQLNPVSAITSTESKYAARMIITAASLFAVLAVILVGNGYLLKKPQTTDINASVNLKKSMRGTVRQVDQSTNTFTVNPNFSYDPVISRAAKPLWDVTLPPGTGFYGAPSGVGTCFALPDLDKPGVNARAVTCREIIRSGSEIIVQYAVIKPANASMIAGSVFGKAE
jgi:hypothetical protein